MSVQLSVYVGPYLALPSKLNRQMLDNERMCAVGEGKHWIPNRDTPRQMSFDRDSPPETILATPRVHLKPWRESAPDAEMSWLESTFAAEIAQLREEAGGGEVRWGVLTCLE